MAKAKQLMQKLQTARKRFNRDERGEGAMSDIAAAGILVVLAFVIVFAFLPILTSSAEVAADDPNASAPTATLIRLIPFVVVAGLLIGAVVFLVRAVNKING